MTRQQPGGIASPQPISSTLGKRFGSTWAPHAAKARSWAARALLFAASAGALLPGPAVAQFAAASTAAASDPGTAEEIVTYGTRNLYRAGRTVRTGAPIDGDYYAAGSRIVVDAPIKGDAALMGGTVEVRAPIGEDLRSTAGRLTVDAPVGGEVMLAGSEIELTRAATVGGDATIAGRSVRLAGNVGGRVTIYAQTITIAGEITGDARLVGEEIELLEGARIGGALSYSSPGELKKAAGVTIGGEVTRTKPEQDRERERKHAKPRAWGWAIVSGTLLWNLGLFVAGAVLLLVLPGLVRAAPRAIESLPWNCLGLGFAMLFATPALGLLLIVTLIGIPLGLAVFALYPVMLLVGYLLGAWFVAQRLRRTLARAPKAPAEGAAGLRVDMATGTGMGAGTAAVPPPSASVGSQLVWLALALILLAIVGWVPFLGWLVVTALTIAGVGALGLAASGWIRGPAQ